MELNASDIESWERFYRANLINSLSGFKSVNLIGTANSSGLNNLAIFSSITHIGSNPPLIGFINRPEKASAHTISNIRQTGTYTINQVHPSFLKAAHQTSAKYPESISEFNEVGLTPELLPGITAPFVRESRVKYALSLVEIIPIKWNDTQLIIGKIFHIKVQDNVLQPDGFLDLEISSSLCSNGNDAYYETHKISRLSYAKPGIDPAEIG